MSAPANVLGVDVLALAACHQQYPSASVGTLRSVQAIQSAHRLAIIQAWVDVGKGQLDLLPLQGNVFETGCGQGDQTAAMAAFAAQHQLATVVSGQDPGPPDYGSPYTLSEAQAYLGKSDWIRPHLHFEPLDGSFAPQVLDRYDVGHFNTIVAAMCLWYFASEEQVLDVFRAARARGMRYMLLAEWALHASSMQAVPHVLAVMLQILAPKGDGLANVRLLLSPDKIKRLAEQAGWRVEREKMIVPLTALHDGRWEVDAAKDAAEASLKANASTTIDAALYALRQASPATSAEIASMDMWTAVLVPV